MSFVDLCILVIELQLFTLCACCILLCGGCLCGVLSWSRSVSAFVTLKRAEPQTYVLWNRQLMTTTR